MQRRILASFEGRVRGRDERRVDRRILGRVHALRGCFRNEGFCVPRRHTAGAEGNGSPMIGDAASLPGEFLDLYHRPHKSPLTLSFMLDCEGSDIRHDSLHPPDRSSLPLRPHTSVQRALHWTSNSLATCLMPCSRISSRGRARE